MKPESGISISRIAAGVLYGLILLDYAIGSRYHPDLFLGWLVLAGWFGIPVFIIWRAQYLVGKIRFGMSEEHPKVPPWAIRALGWLIFGIQIVGGLFLPWFWLGSWANWWHPIV